MNDERFLKDWLQDTSDTDSEAQASADKVMAAVPETPQRHRWLPWPPARRSKLADTSPDRRTRFMFSPLQTITAGALTLAITGVMLVATPFDDSTPPAPLGAELDPTAASMVTGTITLSTGPLDSQGTSDVSGGVTRTEGVHYTNLWETSDPRLSGTATYDAEWLRFPLEDFQVEAATHILENAEGRWFGQGSALAKVGLTNTDSVIMRGEGAYEGLTAFVLMDWSVQPPTITAAVIPGEMPTAPEPLSE